MNYSTAFKPQAFFLRLIVLTGFFSSCSTLSSSQKHPVSGEFMRLQDSPLHSATPTATSEAMAYFSLGLNRELQKDYAGAIEAFQNAIRSDSNNDALYMLVSERLIQANRMEDAFALLKQLIEKQPDNGTAYRWLAKLYLQQGKTVEAREQMMKAVNCLPLTEQIYLEALQFALKEQDLSLSLEILRKANLHAENPIKSTELLIRLLDGEMKRADDVASLVTLESEKNGILEKAIADFTQVETFSFLQAEHFIEQNKLGPALDSYALVDERKKGTSEIREKILVHAIRSLGGGAQAVRAFQKALFEKNDSSFTFYLRGLIGEITDEPELAMDAYRKALELDEGNYASLQKLALLTYQNNQTQEAMRLIERVLEVQPENPELLLLAGQIALSSQDYASARTYFEKRIYRSRQGAEMKNPDMVYAQLSMALFALEVSSQSLADAMVKASESPGNLEWVWGVQVNRILRTRERDKEKAEAMELFLVALLEDLADRLPANPEPEWLLGRTFRLQKDYSKVLQAYERYGDLARVHPQSDFWLNEEYYFDLAAAYERTGNIAKSVEIFQEIIARNPNHHPSLNYIAYMWAERAQNLDQAESYVRRALRLDPENGSYIDTLGWVYFHQGNFKAALRELLRSAELEPQESVIAEHLGDVLMKLDRPWEALSYYKIALMLDPAERLEIVQESMKNAQQALSAQFK